jgi:hypothetical protein
MLQISVRGKKLGLEILSQGESQEPENERHRKKLQIEGAPVLRNGV